MSDKSDKLTVTVTREFPGDAPGDPGFSLTATWRNTTAGNDALQALLGIKAGEAFKLAQEAKDAKSA